MDRDRREHWSSKLGFLMAAAGSAIGLGSLWRFPYMVAHYGGGLFVISYLFFTFLVALPVFIAELIIGRKAQRGPVDALLNLSQHASGWSSISWLCVATNVIILSFYSVVSGWSLHYLVISMQNFTLGKTAQQIAQLFDQLYMSPDLNILWLFVFMLLTAWIVLGGIKKGIEMWARILTPILFILMIILLAYCASLPGFGQALSFLFSFNWAPFNSSSVLQALGMAFFTMSVGLGVLITYGSYMQPNQSIPQISISVAALNVFVSLMGSVIIFSMVFSFDFALSQGPGLVFKILPVLFAQLPGTQLLCTLFFLVLVLTAITSSISILEVLVTTSIESWGWSRRKSVATWSTLSFILALPSALSGWGHLLPNWKSMYGQDFLTTMNALSDWLLAIASFAFAWLSARVMPKSEVDEEFIRAGGRFSRLLNPVWRLCAAVFAPFAIAFIVVHKLGMLSIFMN